MNVDFNFTKELMYDVEKHLYDNPDTRRLVDELNMPNDKTFGIFIENGDWKHEHLWLDHLVSDYLNSRGIEFDSFTKQVGTSDSDCYTAWHYFHILGEAEPMFYDVEGDDELAASKAQEVANTLKYPVSCRGTVYKPNLNEDSRKKKQPCDSIIKDAGNVEHNVAMFNKMNSPAEAPCTNPVSGPMGESLEGSDKWMLIKTDKWYDPEGLGIEPKGQILCSGTEEECRVEFYKLVNKFRMKEKTENPPQLAKVYIYFIKIEKLTNDTLVVYYPQAQSKDVYQLVKKDAEATDEAVEKKAPILYVIKDSHGNILSRPNEDDDELWDRVSSMEARGKRGLCVVACTPDILKKEELEEAHDPYFTPYGYKDAAKVLNGKAPEYYYHLKEIEMDQGDGKMLARYARKLGLPVVQDPKDDPDYPTFYILGKYHWNDYFYPYPSSHEPTDEINESYVSRDQMIDELKRDGRRYNFNRFTDAQIYKMYQKYIVNKPQIEDDHTDEYEFVVHAMCDRCGIRLNDGGTCPVCDHGEEDYFDVDESLSSIDTANKKQSENPFRIDQPHKRFQLTKEERAVLRKLREESRYFDPSLTVKINGDNFDLYEDGEPLESSFKSFEELKEYCEMYNSLLYGSSKAVKKEWYVEYNDKLLSSLRELPRGTRFYGGIITEDENPGLSGFHGFVCIDSPDIDHVANILKIYTHKEIQDEIYKWRGGDYSSVKSSSMSLSNVKQAANKFKCEIADYARSNDDADYRAGVYEQLDDIEKDEKVFMENMI